MTTEGVAKVSLLYRLMIISHGIYWERFLIILYAIKIVWFCSESTKLLFQLDICCSLLHYKILGHLDSISVAWVRSHGSSSKALLGRKFHSYCLEWDKLGREEFICQKCQHYHFILFLDILSTDIKYKGPFSRGFLYVKYHR